LPVAYLICNQTPPVGNQPSLMTFAEVETLLHEFGHGLQHMLTQVDNGLVSGIRGVEWDAVELPSQFMENWALHPGTMAQLSGHFETGAPLPADLFAKLLAARTYRSGSDMLRQLTFAMTDLALHTASDASALDAFAVHRQIAEKTAPLPPLPEDRFLCSFGHIFAGGYAAGYYSYKWAEILSADAFAAFEEAGLDEPATVAAVGKRFADTVLGLGGAEEPMAVFTAFRGREPAVEALLRHAGLA
jgi:oligopeptidase A